MSTTQKVVSGILGIALLTTLLMKDRQTVPVLGAVTDFSTKLLGTAMGIVRPNA